MKCASTESGRALNLCNIKITSYLFVIKITQQLFVRISGFCIYHRNSIHRLDRNPLKLIHIRPPTKRNNLFFICQSQKRKLGHFFSFLLFFGATLYYILFWAIYWLNPFVARCQLLWPPIEIFIEFKGECNCHTSCIR